MRGSRVWGRLALAGAVLIGCAQGAAAQTSEPIGIFAADVRVLFPKYKQDPGVATDLAVDTDALPGRGLGLLVGAHVYPLRRGVFTLGVGAEWLRSRGRKTEEISVDPVVEGPEVQTTFSAFSPQVSFNFGARQGWSYLTAGYGWATLGTERADIVVPDAGSVKMLNYGGGARWFAQEHLAVNLDLRWYSVAAQEANGLRGAYPKTKMMVMSAGISIK